MSDTTLTLTVVALVGLLAGIAVGWQLATRRRHAAAADHSALREQLAEQAGRLREAESTRLRTEEDLAWQRRHNGDLEKQIQPLQQALRGLREQMSDAEHRRARSEAELGERVSRMARDFAAASQGVQREARALTAALGRTEKRGAWGEMQLRTLVEASGLVRHVHFVEQDHTSGDGESAALRPDLVVDLAGDRHAVVDCKVPLDAFLRLAAEDGDAEEALAEHGRLVRGHIQSLGGKEYWRRYNSPEFVILFLPSEGLLSSALEASPDMIQYGLDRKVLLATPTTLLAMLHTITYSWRQVEMAQQARAIQAAGVELYDRLVGMADKFDKVGKSLSRAVADYNGLVGSVERRVLVSGRRMQEMGVSDCELATVGTVADQPRRLTAPDWVDVRDPQSPPAATRPEVTPESASGAA